MGVSVCLDIWDATDHRPLRNQSDAVDQLGLFLYVYHFHMQPSRPVYVCLLHLTGYMQIST